MTRPGRRRSAVAVAGLLALGALLAAPAAGASEALWTLLQAGGHVVLLRHSPTDPGVGDPPGFRLDDCATQRNLSEVGRAQARRLGAAFRAKAVPVGEVLSSPWCRCLETGRLAFGRAEPWSALDSQFQDKSRAAEQARAVRERASHRPTAGNLVMISHGTNIVAWTGVYPAQGEMVILTPRGDGGFAVAGKLVVE
jgi:broad specificity phosphatase PhoE